MGTKRILAIDGGGIRGLIPALVLVEIERQTGKRVAEVFDLIAGTSTGGILAAGLCVPSDDRSRPRYDATELVSLYQEHGAEIFSGSILRKIVSVFFGPEYSARNLEHYLRKQLGESHLADAFTGLLITSYDMRTGAAWFFSRAKAQQDADRNYMMWEVARATSAAPTYFPPMRLLGNGSPGALVDGGVFANNPALCAWVDEHEGVNATSDVMILSLGTGSVPHPVTFDRARRWGKLFWAQPAIGAFMDGQSDTAQYQLQKLLDPSRYLRLQVELPAANERMDDASPANLEVLERAAQQMLADARNAQALAAFCGQITAGGSTAAAAALTGSAAP